MTSDEEGNPYQRKMPELADAIKEANVEDFTPRDWMPLAGFGVRLLALAIDSLLIAVSLPVFSFLLFVPLEGVFRQFSAGYRSAWPDSAQVALLIIFSLLSPLICAAYYLYSWTSYGAGPGGRLLGLRIVQRDGSPINLRKAIIRFLASIAPLSVAPALVIVVGFLQDVIQFLVLVVPTLVIGLGYLWAAFDREKQTWHDKIASTYVMTEKEIPRQRVIAALGLLLALTVMSLGVCFCFALVFV